MKIFLNAFVLCALLYSCASMHQASTINIPEDSKDVQIVKRSELTNKTDVVNIKHAEQLGDYVVFDVSYSGGCAEHSFDLITSGEFTATYPPEVEIKLMHNKNGDGCRSIIDKKLYFYMEPLQYNGTNKILLVIKNTNKTLEYNY